MKYDDASWHYGGTFPSDLPPEAGGTHIGMMVAWLVLNGHMSEELAEDFEEDAERLKARETTPGAWFMANCDEKFVADDWTDEAKAFIESYYEGGDSKYLADYTGAFPDYEEIYRVPDSWTNFDRLSPAIDRAFAEFQLTQ